MFTNVDKTSTSLVVVDVGVETPVNLDALYKYNQYQEIDLTSWLLAEDYQAPVKGAYTMVAEPVSLAKLRSPGLKLLWSDLSLVPDLAMP